MPNRPLRICRTVGCSRLTDDKWCEHCITRGKARESNSRGPHRKQQHRWYNSARWKRASRMFKRNHPICAICETEPTECTDHIVPPKGDEKLFWDETNWQPACLYCNAVKGGRE